MLNIPPHLEACRPRGLFSIFHGTSSPVARRCPRASDLVLSAEHAFLLYERPGLHLQSGASAVGGVLRGARRQVWAGLADPMRISIRAPRAGCDGGGNIWLATNTISIHAPRAGRDTKPARTTCRYSDFNPRAPCGARHEPQDDAIQAAAISIHAPHGRGGVSAGRPAGRRFLRPGPSCAYRARFDCRSGTMRRGRTGCRCSWTYPTHPIERNRTHRTAGHTWRSR